MILEYLIEINWCEIWVWFSLKTATVSYYIKHVILLQYLLKKKKKKDSNY